MQCIGVHTKNKTTQMWKNNSQTLPRFLHDVLVLPYVQKLGIKLEQRNHNLFKIRFLDRTAYGKALETKRLRQLYTWRYTSA